MLKTRVQSWEQLCAIYMPGLLQLLTDFSANSAAVWDFNPNPEDVDLWLPSQVPENRQHAVCAENILEMELKLRTAPCIASLDNLRHVLHVKTHMVYYKNKNISGQRDSTRSRSIIDRVHQHAFRQVQKYCAA